MYDQNYFGNTNNELIVLSSNLPAQQDHTHSTGINREFMMMIIITYFSFSFVVIFLQNLFCPLIHCNLYKKQEIQISRSNSKRIPSWGQVRTRYVRILLTTSFNSFCLHSNSILYFLPSVLSFFLPSSFVVTRIIHSV